MTSTRLCYTRRNYEPSADEAQFGEQSPADTGWTIEMPDKSTDNSTHNRRSPAEHLKPHWFKPGESGNPGGRPKKPIKERLLQRLREDDAMLADLIEAILQKAKNCDVQAFNSIRDTIEGKPVKTVESSGPDGGEIQSRLLIEFV